MGRFITEAGAAPDRIVTSTAVRARATLALAAEAGGWAAPVRETQTLYGATPDAVLREIRAEDDSAAVLLLVGHEPTWSETVSRLIGGGALRVPTAAVARVDFHADRWADVGFGRGELAWLVPPKAL